MGARARRAVTSLTLLAACLVGGGVALAPTADAATCTSAGGVSVVVDYRELGGGVVTACAADGGGKSATAIFASAGVSLAYAQRSPGFVCKVNGRPESEPCVNTAPADAYWGLWWSDGSKGSWTYASSGAGALTVPAGGSVGWAWQQDRAASGAVPPGAAPPLAPAPTPTQSPTSSPTSAAPTSSPSATPNGGTKGGKGGGSEGGKGGGTDGGKDGGKDGGSSATPSPSSSPSETPGELPGSSPSIPTESPLADESPGDSTSPKRADGGRKFADRKGPIGRESPGDSSAEDPSESAVPGLESPGDSRAIPSSEAARPTDQPGRVPTSVTVGVLAALALAIAGGVVVSRRRRGA